MKKILALAVTALLSLSLSAQSIVETSTAIGEITVPACEASVQKDLKLVKGALEQYLKDNNLKTKSQEGFYAAIQQVVPAIGNAPVNFYTKAEERGKKKDKAVVITVAVIGNDLTIDQAQLRDNAKSWLSSFVQYISRYEAQQQMNAEQKNLDKAQKTADKAVSAVAAIEKSIENNNKKIEDKKARIEKLKNDIKDCEKDIQDLKADNEKLAMKKTDAQQKVKDAQQDVNNVQGEVDRYRQMAQ